MSEAVVTPEAVPLDLEPATVGSRGVAILIDYALLFGGMLLLTGAQAAFGLGGYVPEWFGIAVLLLLVFAWQLGYPVGFETLLRGRTPGKLVLGLRVVTQEGGPIGFRHAMVRAAVGLVELTGSLGILAVVASFVSARGQRLGDLAAGTLVVRERRSARSPRPERFEIPPGLEDYVRRLDVTGLQTQDRETIRDLLRRPLAPDVRRRVARQVAAAIAPRVRPEPPTGVDALTWLQAVAAALQTRAVADGPSRPASANARPGLDGGAVPTHTPVGRPPLPPTPPPARAPGPASEDQEGTSEESGGTSGDPPAPGGGFRPPA